MNLSAVLKKTELLREASDEALDDLARRAETVKLAARESLFSAGDAGDALYVIARGSIELHRGETHLDDAREGACIGEMALFTGTPRSASARATEPTTVIRLQRAMLTDAFARHPEGLAWGIIRELADKVRSSIRVRVEMDDARKRLEAVFSRSVSSALLERVLSANDPERLLEGREVDATVLFLDIRDSTTVIEGLPPTDAIRFANTFLGPLADIAMSFGGMIERFTGDGFKVVFGLPLADAANATRAVTAALAMRRRLHELNAAHSYEFKPCRVGIGCASGRGIAGCLGTERRIEFTVGGDVTNTGARVESLTKRYATDLLFTGATASAVRGVEFLRRVDGVRLKGKTATTELFDVVSSAAHAERYAAAFRAYSRSQFDEAAGAFDVVARDFNDGVASALAARARTLGDAPPPSWDGIFEFTEK